MNAPVDIRHLANVSLEDRLTLDRGRIYVTGTQALVRLPLLQRQRDARAGLNTAGYVSGYRGSPLGGLDQQIEKSRRFYEQAHIRFQPGVNEDIAATALWGTQQIHLQPGAKYDGVFGMWYGKGPGVDRTGDVFRHANAFGTSPHGGVLALAGDDHGAKSSTQAAQSDYIFQAVGMPVLAPSSVQELIDFGLHGFAMSRYSGCWVAMKCVTDVVEGAQSVEVDPDRVQVRTPADFTLPPGGVHIRAEFSGFAEQERRLYHHKLYAALAYARANGLDRTVWDAPAARLGIVATGKAYNDVRQALDDLGIDPQEAARIGIRLFKVGMPWPLEPQRIGEFCRGLDEVLVVEEKRPLVEYQLKEQLYALPDGERPRIVGKFEGQGEWSVPQGRMLLPSAGELTPGMVARVLAERIGRFHASERMQAQLAWLAAKEQEARRRVISINRLPYFCSGCPHNTSTRVPEGSRALAGIGCHYMVQWMDRSTATFSHMGGEGAAWLGQAPFVEDEHVFVNLGDGTYFHSGVLAIRAAVAAKSRITYKILFNDAVALTGGQRHDGPLTVPRITRQLAAEGVGRIVVVTDEPSKYDVRSGLAAATAVVHRDELDRVQRELREFPEVSAIVYDQTCAAEKRRRRKRGEYPDPPRRVVINEEVCEGCGDCGMQSNCVAVKPVETELGRKRQVDQSDCNKDFSCVKGFCPSFVTVQGGRLRRGQALAVDTGGLPALPEPEVPTLSRPFGILVTGIGGTGVVTIGQVIGMAAHLEGRGVNTLDMTGLAQKNGAVHSYIRLAARPEELHAARIGAGGAATIIGCDLVTTAGDEAMAKVRKGVTRAVVNAAVTPLADFARKPDAAFPHQGMQQDLADALGTERIAFIDARELALRLLGDAIAANMLMLGFAWQQGLVPVSRQAIERAIELNAVAVEQNRMAFLWGRRAAHDLAAVQALITRPTPARDGHDDALDAVVARRMQRLVEYQDAQYAQRYRALVDEVRRQESERVGGTRFTEAVARYYFKLLAVKDEYEVARLHASPAFAQRLGRQFEGDFELRFHLAPPVFNKPDPATGVPRKSEYGPWILPVFRGLARLKFLRDTWLDPFGRTEERRLERKLARDYEDTVRGLSRRLTEANLATATAVASLPEEIRGFGHVKLRSIERARAREAELLAQFAEAAPST